MTGKFDDYSIDLYGLASQPFIHRDFMVIMFSPILFLWISFKFSSRHMGKCNPPTPPKMLGRQECSVLSSWPEEESWAEELLTGKTTDGHSDSTVQQE